MPQPLRVLIVEDCPADAELIVAELNRAGFTPKWQRVDTETEYAARLRPDLDVIISDYQLPEFSGPRALEMLCESGLAIPFIIVSGVIGEETAVAALRQGAVDYLLKDRITRLGPAVEHAVEEARLRRRRAQAESALRESEERFRQLAENIQDVFWLTDPAKNQMLYISPAYEKIWGRPCAELYAAPQTWLDAIHPDDRERVLHSAMTSQVIGGYSEEYRIVRPDGSVRWIRDRAFPVTNAAGEIERIAGVARDVTESREANEALRLFRDLVDQSNDTFEVIDPETGRFLDVNEKGLIELGYTREEYLSLQVFDIIPTLTDCTWRQAAEYVRTAGVVSREDVHRRKDGSTFPVELNAKWVQLDRDYIVVVVRDITARKQAEEHLREKEAMLANAQRIGGMGSWNIDLRSGRLAWSEATCDLFGIAPREFAETFEHFYSLILPEDRPACEAEHRRVSPARPTLEVEYRIRRRDGEVRWMYERGNIEFDAAGHQIRRLGMVMDITGRKQAEERLQQQAQMLDQAHEAIIVRDFHSRQITSWNQGAERLYGWSAAEVVGRDMGGQIYADPAARDSVTEQLLQTGTWHGEHEHLSKSGRNLIVSSNATLVRDSAGHPKSVLLINIDVTEQKALEARLLRAQRMESIGALAGGIAHDLNNSLAPVITSLDLLKMRFPDPASQDLLDIVSTSAQHGADMVRQVLSFARGVEGRRMEVQTKHLVHEIEKIVSDTFLKNVEVRTIVPHDLWTVTGDPTQLHQVLLNLCVNARDAMPHGGKLTLSATNVTLDAQYAGLNPDAQPGPYVFLQVEDKGTGIPPKVIDKIFDPFFTTKEVGQGTGLGLSTSLAIVKSHGGFMRVYSEVGKGTVFQVYVPAHTGASPGPAAELAPELPRGNGELILVVDDHVSVREITRQTLEAYGYRVALAGDGIEATAAFASRGKEFAAVLTDMSMPVMDGLATIHVLRRMNPKVPIIAASGLADKNRIAELERLDVKHFLSKPYTAETLLKALRQVFANAP